MLASSGSFCATPYHLHHSHRDKVSKYMVVVEEMNHVVGPVLLVTDMWYDTVNVVTATALTQTTPVDGSTAAHRYLHPIAMYVPQSCQYTHTQRVNICLVVNHIPAPVTPPSSSSLQITDHSFRYASPCLSYSTFIIISTNNWSLLPLCFTLSL